MNDDPVPGSIFVVPIISSDISHAAVAATLINPVQEPK